MGFFESGIGLMAAPPDWQKVIVANKAMLQSTAPANKANAYTAPRRRLTKNVV